ncbi:MAG TPA: MBL fold metallo-hydrolase [Bacteroidia bacterium]|jgi:metallo-beta-lactamase family protein|nr:MBL fold metallo-hydrolase [Bacteroidia bacterium]
MSTEKITINFLGAAGTVTGSKYLVQAFGKKLLVDCGMFQGLKKLRLLNWEFPPVNIHEIDAVLLTHGHLDHCGYLPKLVNAGFHGTIHGTLPTLEITEIILKDSAKIQEEDAERANRHGYTKHKPAKPFYDLKDVDETLPHFKAEPLDEWIHFDEGIKFRFRYNGHIIGATFIELEIGGKLLVFSGDIGREHDLLMRPPLRPSAADVLFIESTYGDRLHPSDKSDVRLAEVVNQTYARAGSIIIPSFAVERTQTLMFLLWQMVEKKTIPDLPIYMDSPMGTNVLEVFHKYHEWHKLPIEDCVKMCERIRLVKSPKETKTIVADYHPKIVIAGSGMATGGRVLAYLDKYLGDEMSTILLVGYQAEGTRGRDLLEGKQEIKLHGQMHKVKAHIEEIEGLSAHADQRELINWMSDLKKSPEKIFIVHGETKGANGLQAKIKERYGWESVIPELYSIYEIPL